MINEYRFDTLYHKCSAQINYNHTFTISCPAVGEVTSTLFGVVSFFKVLLVTNAKQDLYLYRILWFVTIKTSTKRIILM